MICLNNFTKSSIKSFKKSVGLCLISCSFKYCNNVCLSVQVHTRNIMEINICSQTCKQTYYEAEKIQIKSVTYISSNNIEILLVWCNVRTAVILCKLVL